MHLVHKQTQALIDLLDKFIGAYKINTGNTPPQIAITKAQYKIIEKEARANRTFAELMQGGKYKGVQLIVKE